MTENPQAPPINDTDKLAVTLRELEAERQRRMSAGQWSCAVLPKLVAIKETGETVEVAQQRALYAHLADNPDAPKAIAAYDWIVHEIIDPKPAVELPGEQFDQPDTRDVSPPPYRPPMPPSSARSLPPAPGAGALSADPARMNIPARILDAEQRRTRNFNDDTWGDPSGWPIRYPRGNRSGW
jgi:hypothetical protein